MTEKIVTKLYNGEVEVTFLPNSHRYQVNGKSVIGVTSITGILDKPALIYWATGLARDYLSNLLERGSKITREEIFTACNLHADKKEKAATIGSYVHKFAEDYANAYINGTPKPIILDNLDIEIINGINAFLEFIITHKVEFISTERFVYSRKHNFCGKCDAIALVDGKYTLVDYKTSNGIYNEHLYQVSGYSIALEEEDQKKFDQHIILKFGKETGEFGSTIIDQITEIAKNKKAFLNCLGLKNRDKELYKPKQTKNA